MMRAEPLEQEIDSAPKPAEKKDLSAGGEAGFFPRHDPLAIKMSQYFGIQSADLQPP